MSARTSAWLVLEDGTAYQGRSVGAAGETFAEVVFNTSMTGYQEILTDPSYRGQVVCMTYPHIGNYGVNEEDAESRKSWVEGFVMKELSPVASNFRSQESLDAYLKRNSIIAMDSIDTRALTLKIRNLGAMKCGISTTEQDPKALFKRVQASANISTKDLVREVTCDKPYEWPLESRKQEAGSGKHIAVIDFGVKYNILRQLTRLGCRVSVVPATTSAEDVIKLKADGIVLSNGPGDPEAAPYAVETIKKLIGKAPMLGICLGNQLLGLAYGGRTFKLKFGHHGGNHPVQDLATKKVEITAQNHNYAVDLDSIPQGKVEVTHKNLNDNTVEGMRHKEFPVMSLQYHPEAGPGPHDSQYLFKEFLKMVEKG